jgi:mono/diheme cytochrome c family protein
MTAWPRQSHSRLDLFGRPWVGARFIRRLWTAFALVTLTAAAHAADPTHGEKLARQWCAACHVVASDQKGTVAEAPPFATIARKPDFDTAKIALFLLDPHPKMPNMNLSRAEAADLAAYIKTLK